jgi:DNA polymerase zeta
MPLELDIIAPAVLNRAQLVERKLHHTLVLPGPERPTEPLVTSVRELWEDERNRRRARGLDPTPEIPNDPSEASRRPNSAWVAEARWWEEIRKRLESEVSLEQQLGNNDSQRWETQVMSVFESTEALWEVQHRTWKPEMEKTDETVDDKTVQGDLALSNVDDSTESGEVDVNEVLLAAETVGQFEDIDGMESDKEGEHDQLDEEFWDAEEQQEDGGGERQSDEASNSEEEQVQNASVNAGTRFDKTLVNLIFAKLPVKDIAGPFFG